MSDRIQVHVPYQRLAIYLEYLKARHLNPEVYFPAGALEGISREELAHQSRELHDAGLVTTIHAPFMDLNPGALDASIRDVTKQRFQQVFMAAELLKPRVIVFHPGYDELRYGDNRLAWLENSISFWREMLPTAKDLGCTIAIENIFEKEPSTLRDLLEEVNDPAFRHCFDAGHWNMFTTVTMEEWFAELGPFIAESHIHDNHGQIDEHLPLGEGEIDFDQLFELLKRHAPNSVWTIEAHSKERLERALKNIGKYLPTP